MSASPMVEGFVHIVESPSPSDLLHGQTEGRVLSEALQLAAIPHRYNLTCDRTTFAEAIGARLVDAWRHFQRDPILHLSMHGNASGVELTSGDFIQWEDLRAELQPIATAMNGALLICMSSCFGVSGYRMALNEGSEPTFWAIVGHPGDAHWADAAVAYVSFYHLFFKGRDLASCVRGMREAAGDERFLWIGGESVRRGWKEHLWKVRSEALSQALHSAARVASLAGEARPQEGPQADADASPPRPPSEPIPGAPSDETKPPPGGGGRSR